MSKHIRHTPKPLSLRAKGFLRLCHVFKRILEPMSLEQLVIALRKGTSSSAFASVPKGTLVENTKINGVRCEWVKPQDYEQASRLLVYFHGGAYIAGSLDSHRDIVYHMAKRLGARAISVDYRLAPEHQYPEPYDDALHVYKGLLAMGEDPEQIILAGDSAGAHLSLILTKRLIDQGIPTPMAQLLFSPFGDATNSLDSRQRNKMLDPLLPLPVLEKVLELIVPEGFDPADPDFSPANMNYQGFPPTFINAGDEQAQDD